MGKAVGLLVECTAHLVAIDVVDSPAHGSVGYKQRTLWASVGDSDMRPPAKTTLHSQTGNYIRKIRPNVSRTFLLSFDITKQRESGEFMALLPKQ